MAARRWPDQPKRLVRPAHPDLIVGLHTSAVRVGLRKVTTRHRIPYIYTPVYEGGEQTPGVMAIGETPRWQSRPSIHWLADVKKAARWYLIGSDYVWPWQSHRAVKRYISDGDPETTTVPRKFARRVDPARLNGAVLNLY